MPKLNRFKYKQHFLYFVVAVLSLLLMRLSRSLILRALFLIFMKRNINIMIKKFSNTIRTSIQMYSSSFFTVYSQGVMFIIQPIIPLSNISNSFRKHGKKFGMVLETFYIFLVINVMQITVTCERETYNTNNFSWYSNSKLYCALRISFKLIFTGRVVYLCKSYLI